MSTPTQQTSSSGPVPRPRTGDEFGCLFCSGVAFRRSRLRPRDFANLMRLRYPVRCLRCSKRQFVSFSLAGLSIPASVQHHRVRTDAETWKAWTTGETGTPADPSAPSPATPAFPTTANTRPRPTPPDLQ